jgi:hypothetical protein
LQLFDPRIVDSYNIHLTEQLLYHKIPEKVQELSKIACSGAWAEVHTASFEKIDK